MSFSNKSDEILISYIVAYRLFGIDKKKAKLAMQELINRSKNNNSNFESLIEDKIKSIEANNIN